MEFKITKERLGLSETNVVIKELLTEWFPDAFRKVEIGKWYIASCGNTNGHLMFATEITDNNKVQSNYWFTPHKSYNYDMGIFDRVERLATAEEVDTALRVEAIKRYGKNWQDVNIKRCMFHGLIESKFVPCIMNGEVWGNNGCLFFEGKWAEKLEEKTVITKEKALKILAKKYKTTVDNIEIK